MTFRHTVYLVVVQQGANKTFTVQYEKRDMFSTFRSPHALF